MDKIYDSILYPMIITPIFLMCVKRFTFFFNLDWDRVQITSFEKFKHKVIDSLLITLVSFFNLIAYILTDKNSSTYRQYEDTINKLNDSALIAFSFFLVFISVYMLIDIYNKNILPSTKIQIKVKNKYYPVSQGNDNSLHIINSENPKQFKRYGKTLLDESLIEYCTIKEQSKVNKWIENKINEQQISYTYTVNSTYKGAFHLLLTIIGMAVYIILYGLKYDTNGFHVFYWTFFSFSIFAILELSSAIYIPLSVRFVKNTFFKEKVLIFFLTDKSNKINM